MIETLVIILLVAILAYTVFNIDGHKSVEPESMQLSPRLTLSNPQRIISGECSTDGDCVYTSLTCLGNTCVIKPDAPARFQCNESHRCYNVVAGLSLTGTVENICLPLLSQHWNSDNCNGKNPYSCLGQYVVGDDGHMYCQPDDQGVALSYASYGGSDRLMVTLPSQQVANLFVNGNPQVLSIDALVI